MVGGAVDVDSKSSGGMHFTMRMVKFSLLSAAYQRFLACLRSGILSCLSTYNYNYIGRIPRPTDLSRSCYCAGQPLSLEFDPAWLSLLEKGWVVSERATKPCQLIGSLVQQGTGQQSRADEATPLTL
jgi:hypothetical protein